MLMGGRVRLGADWGTWAGCSTVVEEAPVRQWYLNASANSRRGPWGIFVLFNEVGETSPK